MSRALTTTLDVSAPTIELLVAEEAQDVSFSGLSEAVRTLVSTIRDGENARLRAARIVDAIDRQKLYREANCATMKDFMPTLLECVENLGFGSVGSIKRYLTFYRLYIREMNLNPDVAMKSVSHLHALSRIAALDRKTGGLLVPEKEGKLPPEQFEDIVHLVCWLVVAPTKAQATRGMCYEELLPLLTKDGLATQAATFKEVAGYEVELPEGGWTLEDTRYIISTVTQDENVEENKLRQWYMGYMQYDDSVYLERIEWRDAMNEVQAKVPVGFTFSKDVFSKMQGTARAEIVGL